MTLKKLWLATPIALLPIVLSLGSQGELSAQGKGVPPADLLKPLADVWPTYSGDYTGKRYSALKQINKTTVKNLTLAWVAELNEGPGGPGGFGGGGRGGGGPVIIGGEGTGDFVAGGGGTVKGTALVVDGTIYITMPDNAWALDARDGHETVALLLEDEGRHAHRQPRPRDVEQLSLHGDARQLPGIARRQNGQGALAQGHRRFQPGVLLHDGADRCRQSCDRRHRATISIRRDSCSRSIPRPAISSGSSIPCR